MKDTDENRVNCVLVQAICNDLNDNCSENILANTCHMYGVYPLSSSWIYTNICSMQVYYIISYTFCITVIGTMRLFTRYNLAT